MGPLIFSCVVFAIVLAIAYRKKSLRLLNPEAEVKHPLLLILLNVAGTLLFGILPMFYYPLPDLHLDSLETGQTLILGFLVLLTAGFAYFIADKDLRKNTVKVNPTLLGASFLVVYFIVRIAFIIAYEIWFRGFFLFYSIDHFGTLLAVALNVILYVLLHTVNGKREMLSCIPFGILLCAMAIWFESPLPAILIHLALTVPYDIQFVRIKSEN